jgi:hypothetical protein
MVSFSHKSARGGWRCGAAVLVLAALSTATWQSEVSGDEGAGDAQSESPAVAREERLWNIADEPFKYRLGRSHGRPWTDEITLEPGKHQTIRAPVRGQVSDLEGVDGQGDSYVNISYPAMGGRMHLHLPVRSAKGAAMPNWFHVKDANGFSRLIHAADVEQAKARQRALQKERPLTPAEIENAKKMLRANWVFYEN